MKGTFYSIFTVLFLLTICTPVKSQPTWTIHPLQSPFRSGGLMLLMSDGSVLCKSSEGLSDGFGNIWFKLTPDINGSYQQGTWSTAAPMRDSRLYFSSQVLKNGKVYVAGGEYGSGYGGAEMYDPLTNSWSALPIASGHFFGDANSAILDNGNILQADLSATGHQTYIYYVATNQFTPGPACIGKHNETTWIKLPDNSIHFVDANSTTSERYIPALNQWVADANVPVALYDPFIFETGPSMLLPNGKVICFGSTGNTAIYTPSGSNAPGSWVAGPPLPAGKGCPDTQAAMKTDGKIIFTAAAAVSNATNAFDPPTYFYEYDFVTSTFTPIQAPGGGAMANDSAFNFNMLNLPDGTIMLSEVNNKSFYFHKPTGAPLASGVPTINSVTQSGCANSFTATGLLFNGISEGASYGDDWQMNTNFPIIRLQSGANVYYARTFNWNHTGVHSGNQPDTTQFSLPSNIPAGTYSLYLVVNGIPSAHYTFTFNAFPALTSPLTMPVICSGTTFTYNATANLPGTTLQWTRPAVSGINNPAINTPQSLSPAETLTNTGSTPATVVYSYTLTNGSCQANYFVNLVVSNGPLLAASGTASICPGTQNTLVASGADSYTWSNGSNSRTIAVSPSVATVYTVSGKDAFGCTSSVQKAVSIRPIPVFNITGNSTICSGDASTLTVSGNATIFHWSAGPNTSTLLVNPATSTKYKVTCNLPGGCQKTDSILVVVDLCLGLNDPSSSAKYKVYPNPFLEHLNIEFSGSEIRSTTLMVTDALGRLILRRELQFQKNNPKVAVPLNEVEPGIYFLTLEDSSGKSSYKLVKE